MFLKNSLFTFFFLIFFLISCGSESKTNNKAEILNHLSKLKNFSASFLQNDGEELSEGKVYIGKNRVRAEYLYPIKILIILDENKAMYYNYDLEEDEFFNPKNTNAWFFYDIFRNPLFFRNAELQLNDNELILEKKGLDNEEREYIIKVHFENRPIVLRKIEVWLEEDFLEISIYNHNYNEKYDKDFFKLINPNFFN